MQCKACFHLICKVSLFMYRICLSLWYLFIDIVSSLHYISVIRIVHGAIVTHWTQKCWHIYSLSNTIYKPYAFRSFWWYRFDVRLIFNGFPKKNDQCIRPILWTILYCHRCSLQTRCLWNSTTHGNKICILSKKRKGHSIKKCGGLYIFTPKQFSCKFFMQFSPPPNKKQQQFLVTKTADFYLYTRYSIYPP